MLFGYFLCIFLALIITNLAGYHDIIAKITNLNYTDQETLDLFRIFQIAMHMGLFLVGPLLYILLVEPDPINRYGINKSPLNLNYLLIFVLGFVCIPGLNFTHTLNEALRLPGWLNGAEKWMQEKENTAQDLTDAMLKMKTFKDLLINLILFGFLPALGEELVFRGALFSILKDWTGRKHLTVFISAFVFAAIHIQFYGFLPRFLMGVGFGYLFIFTGSLWAPIFAHFLNNTVAVVAAFFYYQGKSTVSQDDFGTVNNLAVNLFSIVLSIYIFRVIYRRSLSARST